MMHYSNLILFSSFVLSASAQALASDPGVYGPAIELVHIYNDEFPTGQLSSDYVCLRLHVFCAASMPLISDADSSSGIAVSSTGRMFSNYPSGLDANNTKYAVAELTSNSTETPYPSAEMNSPPGGAINYTTIPASQSFALSSGANSIGLTWSLCERQVGPIISNICLVYNP